MLQKHKPGQQNVFGILSQFFRFTFKLEKNITLSFFFSKFHFMGTFGIFETFSCPKCSSLKSYMRKAFVHSWHSGHQKVSWCVLHNKLFHKFVTGFAYFAVLIQLNNNNRATIAVSYQGILYSTSFTFSLRHHSGKAFLWMRVYLLWKGPPSVRCL